VSFLLNTNIVSEWVKPQLAPNVVSWLADVDEDRVFIRVALLAESRFGIELMPAGRWPSALGRGLPRSYRPASRTAFWALTSVSRDLARCPWRADRKAA